MVVKDLGELTVPIDMVDVKPSENPRVAKRDLKELTHSIKTFGMINRPLAKILPNGRLKLGPGKGRWDSWTEELKNKEITLHVVDCSDGELYDLYLAENWIRESMGQEAAGEAIANRISCYLKDEGLDSEIGGKDYEENKNRFIRPIAARHGKSEAQVLQALASYENSIRIYGSDIIEEQKSQTDDKRTSISQNPLVTGAAKKTGMIPSEAKKFRSYVAEKKIKIPILREIRKNPKIVEEIALSDNKVEKAKEIMQILEKTTQSKTFNTIKKDACIDLARYASESGMTEDEACMDLWRRGFESLGKKVDW